MARIVFTLEDGTEIETELDSDVITVGRHADSIVVLPSVSVSSHHAIIKRRGDSFYVQDLGTTNGTKLNGVEVEEAKLENGDQLTFGDIPGAVHFTEAPKVVIQALPNVLPATSKVYPIQSMRNPAPGRRPGVRPGQKVHESSGCAGFLFFLGFLFVAFVIGLHVRHSVENPGHVLIMDVLQKIRDSAPEGGEEKAAPAEDAGAAPAPVVPSPAPSAPAPDPAAPATPGAAPAMMNQ